MGHGGTVSEPPVRNGPAPRIARLEVGQGGVYPRRCDPRPTDNASSVTGDTPFEGNRGIGVGAGEDDVWFRDARSCSGIVTII